MYTRYSISLGHAGCKNVGQVVWQGENGPDGPESSHLAVISLPRGFVNIAADDGSIEILCVACHQTVASAVAATARRVPEQAGHGTGQPSAGEGRGRMAG